MIKFFKGRSSVLAVAFLGVLGFSGQASALNCQQVRQLVGVYFKMHFSHHDFDDELSRRTLDNFIKSWDPGKVYFLKSDVKDMEAKYATKLDDMIMDSDCKAIEEITKTYTKRFGERQKVIDQLIDSKFDFTVDEYMTIDRKKMDYASTTEEIAERWRQRVKFQLLQLNNTMKDLPKAKEKLHKRYALGVKRNAELTSDDMYSAFLNSFSSGLDPHSEYYSPEQLEDFRISTSLHLDGIGAVLRSEDGFTTIQELVPGGPAALTGKVNEGDKIIAVAQGEESPIDVIDMDLREVVKLIRGARGTEVRLTLVREEGAKTNQLIIPIIRDQVQLKDRAAKSTVYPITVSENGVSKTYKIGVVDLPSFYMDFEGRQNHEKGYKSSSVDMKNEVEKMKKENVDAMIVDLRSNGGGSLDESIDIAGLFFDKGPVVQIKDTRGSTYVQKDEDPKTYFAGPLVVMINRQSASASEIFAGAIQDYKRGLIVGDSQTFGKGTVQNLNDIDEKLGAVKVTISKFFRPSGSSTQLKGVEADIVFPDILEEYEIGERNYDYALPWEKIATSDYKEFSLVNPDIVKQLQASSKARIATDKGFEKVLTAIKEYKSSEDARSKVSLKEETAAEKAKKEKEQKLADEKSGKKGKDGKKKKKAEEDADDEDGEKLPLAEDFHLQESLRIAGDYIQVLGKRPLGKISIPAADKPAVAEQTDKKKDVKNHP